MPDLELTEALTLSVREVVETMCFTDAVPANKASETEVKDEIAAAIRFHGMVSGSLQLATGRPAACLLAASFLGLAESEVSAEQADDTLQELAKVVCSQILSELRPTGQWQLDSPQSGPAERHTGDAAQRLFQLNPGVLEASVRLD